MLAERRPEFGAEEGRRWEAEPAGWQPDGTSSMGGGFWVNGPNGLNETLRRGGRVRRRSQDENGMCIANNNSRHMETAAAIRDRTTMDAELYRDSV